MSHETRDGTSATFDLPSLIYDLIQRASARLKRRGCYKPDDCAPKLVNDYVVIRKLRKTGRCEIQGRAISLNFQGSRDPLLVLYKLLSFEVMGFKRRCADCNGLDQLADESGYNTKPIPPAMIDPVTPESLLEATELFELMGTAFSNETHRAGFDEIVLGERSYKDVAEQFNISVSTLRQWVCRDKKRIRKVLTTCWP